MDSFPTNQMTSDINAFHRKFKLDYVGRPRQLSRDLLDFRMKFMVEELEEYEVAVEQLNLELEDNEPNMNSVTKLLEDQLDALVDLVYVAMGTAHLQGFDFGEAWDRVHEANMQKVRALSKDQSKRNSTYDVVKPLGWEPPSHTDLVKDHAHRQVGLFDAKPK